MHPAQHALNPAVRRSIDLLVLECAGIRAWESILFVECGDGWIVEEAWRRARRGYACGVDRSSAQVARARKLRGVRNVLEFKAWDGWRLPYPSESFQRVISTCALETCADPAQAFREMHRVLQRGGDVHLFEIERRPQQVPDLTTSLASALGSAGFDQTQGLTRCEIPLSDGNSAVGVLMRGRPGGPSQPLLEGAFRGTALSAPETPPHSPAALKRSYSRTQKIV